MFKLNVKALALAFGIAWGIGMLLSGLMAMSGWAARFVGVMSSVYIGFKPTLLGSLIGGVWGFFDGLIGGAIVAILYNKLAK